MPDTKVVRVEIDAALWKSVKLLAIQRDTSVGAIVAGLLQKEVARGTRTSRKR